MTRQLHTTEGDLKYILLMTKSSNDRKKIHRLIPIRMSEQYRATIRNSSQRQLHLWVC